MKTRTRTTAAALLAFAFCLAITSALAAGGRLQLNLVNAGPETTFYNDSSAVDGDCDSYTKPGSLSPAAGTGVQLDSPG